MLTQGLDARPVWTRSTTKIQKVTIEKMKKNNRKELPKNHTSSETTYLEPY